MSELSDRSLINEFRSLQETFRARSSSAKAAVAGSPTAAPLPDSGLMSEILAVAEGHPLWGGAWKQTGPIQLGKAYPSQSEADFALLGAIVQTCSEKGLSKSDTAAMAMVVFERSGLYRREKRQTKIDQDIPKLLAGYAPRPAHIPSTSIFKGDGRFGISRIAPPPRDFVVQDLVGRGHVTVLAGPGGVSKTMLLLQVATSIALGEAFLGSTKGEPSLLLLGEETAGEASRRLGAIAEHWQLDQGQMNLADAYVRGHPLAGTDARLTSPIATCGLTSTGVADAIIKRFEEVSNEVGSPCGLIGLDHAGMFHGGEFNAAEDVIHTMREIQRIATRTGAAVLLLAHTSKAASSREANDAYDVAGSIAWTNLARAVLTMRKMTEGEQKRVLPGHAPDARENYVSLNVTKNNYGPSGKQFWLKREAVPSFEVGVLDDVTLSLTAGASLKHAKKPLDQRIVELVEGNLCLSKSGLREKYSGKDGPLAASKEAVRASIETMLTSGVLKEITLTSRERKELGLHATVTKVLRTVSKSPDQPAAWR